MAAPTPKTETHTVVSRKNNISRRVISASDLDKIVGVADMHKGQPDLVWEAGSKTRVDITGSNEAVVEYFRKDRNFTVHEVDVPKKD